MQKYHQVKTLSTGGAISTVTSHNAGLPNLKTKNLLLELLLEIQKFLNGKFLLQVHTKEVGAEC